MDTVLHCARGLSSCRVARAARYIAVGALGTGLYYLTLILLVEVLHVAVVTATCAAFVLVVLVNYLLHRIWTFRRPVAHTSAFIPFLGMSATGFGINMAVMAFGISVGIHYLLVQAFAIGIVVTWNYIVMSRIFSQPVELARSSTKGFRK